MKTPEELTAAIRAALTDLPIADRLHFLRSIFVPVLESTGYEVAPHVEADSTSAIFIMANYIDKSLTKISRSIGREIRIPK